MGEATYRDTATDLSPRLGGHLNPLTGREPELSGLRALLCRPPLIVHVDDSKELLTLVRLIVEVSRNYRVQSFTSGEEALAFCQTTRPALLISDLSRPGLDGLELYRLIRADPDLFDLPLIFLSACYPSPIPPGLPDTVYIPKPCHPHELLAEIDRLVEIGIAREANRRRR